MCLGLWLGAAGCSRGGSAEPAAQAPATVSVTVAPVQGVNEPVTIEATGSFEAQESSDVAPEASGRVIATPVDVGQFVNTGAVLVRIQGVDAGLRLEEARAAAARAEANVKLAESQNTLAQTTAQRYASLLATGDVSKTVADQARTQAETSVQSVNTARASLAEARAQLALAEKAVADVVVAAPFSGYISDRKVSLGEYVQPSTAVVTLLKIDPLRLRLTIPGVQAGQVAVGQAVTATVDAFPGLTFSGQVTSVNPAISAEARSFIVEARVPNPGAKLKPGMFAVATIDQGRTARARGRAAEGGRRGRQHELVQDLCDRCEGPRQPPRRAARRAAAGRHGEDSDRRQGRRARRHVESRRPVRRRASDRQRDALSPEPGNTRPPHAEAR